MDNSAEQNILENERDIVERAKKDDHAFEMLYNHYFPKIYGYIFKRVGNHSVAEDIVSITFMKVLVNIKGYEHRGHTFGAWVYRIATNNLTDYYRKRVHNKDVDIGEAQEIQDHRAGPEEQVVQLENRQHIEIILKKLSKRYQHVLHLKFFAELSISEISAALSISENNARVLLHRALKQFRREYEKD
ncbi:hypothetical protein BK004_03625 [bacterium CG10_46_32]|nr:MAG: hypothetical protein BK004_03625 [bacterium CG10_46_32]PIR55888.1 MAG: hypothetical protein COU73_03655 [Parcubacteria group bacterium CG10_big_fil_rev_8_21_14_0_10_46_32]